MDFSDSPRFTARWLSTFITTFGDVFGENIGRSGFNLALIHAIKHGLEKMGLEGVVSPELARFGIAPILAAALNNPSMLSGLLRALYGESAGPLAEEFTDSAVKGYFEASSETKEDALARTASTFRVSLQDRKWDNVVTRLGERYQAVLNAWMLDLRRRPTDDARFKKFIGTVTVTQLRQVLDQPERIEIVTDGRTQIVDGRLYFLENMLFPSRTNSTKVVATIGSKITAALTWAANKLSGGVSEVATVAEAKAKEAFTPLPEEVQDRRHRAVMRTYDLRRKKRQRIWDGDDD